MLVKKSLVLNSSNHDNKKAVLSVEGDKNSLVGRVRLYNFGTLPKGILTLGIYSNGKVYKAGLTHQNGMLYTFLLDENIFINDFSCAVINVYNGEVTPILFGASQGKNEGLSQVVDAVKSAKNMQEVEQVLDDYGLDYDDEEKAEIEKSLDKEFECKDCQNCKYKQYFYSHSESRMANTQKLDSDENLENENEIVEERKTVTFYDELKPQIEKLFSENKEEDYLEKIFPNSKWVKVSLQNDDYYVFGLIYEDDKVKYICYGVPGVYQKLPPRELSGYPSWLALDEQNREGFGYWLSYQDAQSGESVKAIVE